MSDLGPKRVILAPNETIRDYFRSDFSSTIQNVLKSDVKKSRICFIWGQSDPLWAKSDIRELDYVWMCWKQSSAFMRKSKISHYVVLKELDTGKRSFVAWTQEYNMKLLLIFFLVHTGFMTGIESSLCL